jgi:hypothetical protein
MKDKEHLEEQISELLNEGHMSKMDPDEAAARSLSPRWEIRIPALQDSIVEETKRYRQMAGEVDDRYDEYMKQAGQDKPEKI